MLYSECTLGPLRAGTIYGAIAMVVAFVAELYFLFLNPAETADWILAALHAFRTEITLAAFVFLGILSSLRTRPRRTEPDVPHRSLLLRDCTLAATIVAVLAGVALFITTALGATVFEEEMRSYAQTAAPEIAAYVNESQEELSDPPPPAEAEEIEATLQPPQLRELGGSIGNTVLRAILIGATGAIVGTLRGRSSSGEEDSPAKGSPEK